MKKLKEEEKVCCGQLEKCSIVYHCLQKSRDPHTSRDTVIFHCPFVVETQFIYLEAGIKMPALPVYF